MDMAPNNRAYIGESLAIDMSYSCHVLTHPVSFNMIPKYLLSVEAMYIRFACYLFENSANDAIERAGLRRFCARIARRRPGTSSRSRRCTRRVRVWTISKSRKTGMLDLSASFRHL